MKEKIKKILEVYEGINIPIDFEYQDILDESLERVLDSLDKIQEEFKDIKSLILWEEKYSHKIWEKIFYVADKKIIESEISWFNWYEKRGWGYTESYLIKDSKRNYNSEFEDGIFWIFSTYEECYNVWIKYLEWNIKERKEALEEFKKDNRT